MNTNPAKNLLTSFERIPDITAKKEKQEKGLLSPMRSVMNKNRKTDTATKPIVDAVKAFQQIRKSRLDIIEMRKNNAGS